MVLVHPLKNTDVKITSPFGMRKHPVTGVYKLHNGMDLRAKENTNVYSPAKGTISGILTTSGGGKQVTVKHDNGLRTGYAHLNKILVKKGQRVNAGQRIALSGNTGASTGPHLHFTVKNLKTGEYIDPERLRYSNTGGSGGGLKTALIIGGIGLGLYLAYDYIRS